MLGEVTLRSPRDLNSPSPEAWVKRAGKPYIDIGGCLGGVFIPALRNDPSSIRFGTDSIDLIYTDREDDALWGTPYTATWCPNPLERLKRIWRGESTGELEKFYGLLRNTTAEVTTAFSSQEEIFHNVLKKTARSNMHNDLTADERYALAIVRPNILTSEQYASAFIVPQDVSFTVSKTDQGIPLTLEKVESWTDFYKALHPHGSVSVEKGIGVDGKITSVRFVVFNQERQLVVIWLQAQNAYSLHYHKYPEVAALHEFLKTFHVPKKRTIHRCYGGGEKLEISSISIDASMRIHDEFYPSVQDIGGMKKLVNDFHESTSNLMILAGQWGGGKSALFQAACYEDDTEKNVYYLLDDPNVYSRSDLFSQVIRRIEEDNRAGLTSWLFLEESDDFVRQKKDNPFLSRLASLANGAAALRVKVLVATNDTSENQIDPALTRGGRLFAMIKFGLLTPEEANRARAVLNKEPQSFTSSVSLAEALTDAPIFVGVGTAKKARTGFGFSATS